MTQQLTPYTNYQLSAIGVGVIAVGLADIRQCIDFILKTIPGTDPLRPFFGCDIYKYIDTPVNTGIPNMKLAIFEALSLWEPRITVTAITHEIILSQVVFSITYGVIDIDLSDTIIWSTTGSTETGVNSGIILTAQIPVKVDGARYFLDFKVNQNPAFPTPPSEGFETALSMLSWLNANWQNYGRWYYTGSKIVVYLSPETTSASLVINQLVTIVVITQIPTLLVDEFYNLALTVSGNPAAPAFPIDTVNTIEQLISWLQTNWGIYGTFTLQNDGAVIGEGDFSSDFSNDFDTAGVTVNRYIIFQTNKYSSATLIFS